MVANISGIRTFSVAYWACAVSAALAKVVSPRLDSVLRYGVRRFDGDECRLCGGVVGWALKPATFLPTRVCWPLFYATGVVSTLCVRLVGSSPALVLFGAHVTRRLYESVAVHRYSTQGRLSPAHLAMGLSFYVMAPPTLRDAHAVSSTWTTLVMFFLAQLAQSVAHHTLANVKPEVGKYGLPGGLLFCVACPHYAAELVTYCILTYHARSIAVILLLTFTISNLVPSSMQTLHWYAKTFGGRRDLPRYALVKYVF